MLHLALGAALLASAHALPPPPPPVTVTAAEQAELAAGAVVVRWAGPDAESVAIVDVAAPPPVVLAAVMDLPKRVEEIGGLKGCALYGEAPGRVGARWEMGLAVYKAQFHTLYEYDLAAGWSVYTLDDSQDNDLLESAGSYQAYAIPGGSRLVYRSRSRSKGEVPDWLRKRLAHSASREMLGGMKSRAEAAAR